MTEQEFVDLLREVLAETEETDEGQEVKYTSTFSDAGLMTSNDGLVVRLADGSEFQVTVVKSR